MFVGNKQRGSENYRSSKQLCVRVPYSMNYTATTSTTSPSPTHHFSRTCFYRQLLFLSSSGTTPPQDSRFRIFLKLSRPPNTPYATLFTLTFPLSFVGSGSLRVTPLGLHLGIGGGHGGAAGEAPELFREFRGSCSENRGCSSRGK